MFVKSADQAEAVMPKAPKGHRASAPALLALAHLLGRLAALEAVSNDNDQDRDND